SFMEAVFALKDEETTAVYNHDHSAVYVVRLHSRQFPPEELKQRFLTEINSWPGLRTMLMQQSSRVRQSVDTNLLTQVAGFKFDEAWEKRRLSRNNPEQSEQ